MKSLLKYPQNFHYSFVKCLTRCKLENVDDNALVVEEGNYHELLRGLALLGFLNQEKIDAQLI